MWRQRSSFVLLVAGLLTASAPPVSAFWELDGTPVSQAVRDQTLPLVVSDGAGGMIVVWTDRRNELGTDWDIYAQRIDASGEARWTTDGVAICTAIDLQEYVDAMSDGAGGVFVTWSDRRGPITDIYAQRVNASGVVQWTANGEPVCAATGGQYRPRITPDGTGGAIIVWDDNRVGDIDIWAQRINASGVTQWTADGEPVDTKLQLQSWPEIVSDGAGGAIIAWRDWYNEYDIDIFAQRVDANGNVLWHVDGVSVCDASGNQSQIDMAPDVAGGAFIVWQDNRGGGYDIYAERITHDGNLVLPGTLGQAICTATSTQWYPQIISTALGHVIIAWGDSRSGTDIYGQRVDFDGTIGWASNGVLISETVHSLTYGPVICGDGDDGAIIAWGASSGVYAQHMDEAGAAQWGAPMLLSNAPYDQIRPAIVADGSGGALSAWEDYRSGNGAVSDIYAQGIDRHGNWDPAPAIHAVTDVPGDQGGFVNLAWYASRFDPNPNVDITEYTIWRALTGAQAAAKIERGASLLKGVPDLDFAPSGPVIREEHAAAGTFFWELIGTHSAYYLEGYAKVVATPYDSTSVSAQDHYYQVIAHTSDPYVFWVSQPDSGHSVDNLAPAAPQALAGRQVYIPEGLALTWDRNTEADLSHYDIHRGETKGFIPSPANLFASTTDTTALDTKWRWDNRFYYKAAAIDIHENRSPYASLGGTLTGIGPSPLVDYLSQNTPNPFNPTTTIAFGLAKPADITLRIYDTTGRLVRVLADGRYAAGPQAEVWDGRDDSGRPVASGVYFYRLDTRTNVLTRKMLLVK